MLRHRRQKITALGFTPLRICVSTTMKKDSLDRAMVRCIHGDLCFTLPTCIFFKNEESLCRGLLRARVAWVGRVAWRGRRASNGKTTATILASPGGNVLSISD